MGPWIAFSFAIQGPIAKLSKNKHIQAQRKPQENVKRLEGQL
jgi:hypothetical protein